MRVTVKIFGAPSLALERKELTIELAENATAEDLLKSLPVKDKDYLYLVRAGIRLGSSAKINDGDEILAVPPIAGG
ncbi:MAG TPA: MoaD/ThiS family protein [archaeon]|nr:MoaD/ThiS family protein [archaeon]